MSYKILVVDDSKLARMALARALNGLRPEWRRLEATNADEAVALMKHEPADVALLDFNMPGRDGLVLAAELRAALPNLPIALVSANVQREVAARAEEVGASFLSKPLTDDALAAFLDAAEARLRGGAT
jgi:CheY-like chemotaxis protein